jgi:hypothetical protein
LRGCKRKGPANSKRAKNKCHKSGISEYSFDCDSLEGLICKIDNDKEKSSGDQVIWINEAADALAVTAQTLRNWDKKGTFCLFTKNAKSNCTVNIKCESFNAKELVKVIKYK